MSKNALQSFIEAKRNKSASGKSKSKAKNQEGNQANQIVLSVE
nr:MAG TPA: hypothetical protein [Caudoviricetes sp.]